MNCPSCGAANSEEAEFCTLCFARFKAKAPPPAAAPAPTAPESVLLPLAEAERDGWVFQGFLLAQPDGVCFFVSDERYEGGLLRRALVLGLGQAGGLVGNFLVDSAAAARASQEKRPAWPALRHRQEFADATHAALAINSEVVACNLAFFIPKSDIVVWQVAPDGAELDTRHGKLAFGGGGDWAALKAAAQAWRMPVLAAEPHRRRAPYWVAAALGVAGAWFALSDVGEVARVNAKLAQYDGVRGIVITPDGGRYIMPDGSERRAQDVPWSERLPWYRFGLIFGFLVAMGWLISQIRRLRG